MNEYIKCVAIDDEPLALDVITKFCLRIGNIDLTTFADPHTGLRHIHQTHPAIVFLDIDMGNISGLDIASQLPSETCFIFTTAYLDYALTGFELDAVDYLHKPFSFSRFETAINKALRRIGTQTVQNRSITVKQDYNNVNIRLDDIVYIEAMEGYVKIFKTSGECVITRMVLKSAENMLPRDHFIRIHRSFIVSRAKIKSYNRREVKLTNELTLPVGRQYLDAITALKMPR